MRTAHVRCGDDLRETLGPAGFPGDFVPFTDPVCQGPVPRTADPAEFDAIRADWLGQAYDLDVAQVRERLSRERAGLDAFDGYDRVLLWMRAGRRSPAGSAACCCPAGGGPRRGPTRRGLTARLRPPGVRRRRRP